MCWLIISVDLADYVPAWYLDSSPSLIAVFAFSCPLAVGIFVLRMEPIGGNSMFWRVSEMCADFG